MFSLAKFSRLAFLSVGSAALLTACGKSERLFGRPDLVVSNSMVAGSAEVPVPTAADLVEQQRPYVIGPSDKLAIAVFGVEELTHEYQLDSTGRFAMPMVGEISAAGMTPSQLQGLIADRLRGRYIRDPHVSVNLDTSNQIVSVEGQVRLPGLYQVTPQMSLMRAIARAQGTTEDANVHYVVVFRRVAGRNYATLYDLRSIRQGMYADPLVYANDSIYVGESRARSLFQTAIQAGGLLVAPLVTLLR